MTVSGQVQGREALTPKEWLPVVPPPDTWSGQGYRNPSGTEPLRLPGSPTQRRVVAKGALVNVN